jgi:hypothetical protein
MISKGAKSDKELKLEEKAKILRQSKSAKKSVPSVEEMIKKASKLMGDKKSLKERMVPAKKAGGGAMKTKGYAKGGAMKTKGYAKGGAMKTKGASKGGKMRVRPPSGKKSGLYGR